MISKSPFYQDKCATAWEKWEASYKKAGKDKPSKKFKGKSEMEVERQEFTCENGKIINVEDAKSVMEKKEKSIMEQ
tara:strand:+ start:1166 stop:1393 length:228 start_codon:yes stop_codon:yes gene_type:complete